MVVYAIGALVVALAIWLIVVNAGAARLRFDDPQAARRIRTIGRLIADTQDKPVHIVFVHGIRADGPGTAQTFMSGLAKYGPIASPRTGPFNWLERQRFGIGPWPRNATVFGEKVWESEKAWLASRPFADRYVFKRAGAPPVIVDEINWWPLLFPLKGPLVVAPEAQLSGVDKAHLDLLRQEKDPYYPWLSEAAYQKALQGPGISGGGAWGNAELKQQLVSWGLADAVIALGPMRRLIRLAMNEAFNYAATFDGHDIESQEFVVVAESLGSFVVLEAATNVHGDAPRARDVVARTADIWLFANQFRLLELARVAQLAALPEPEAALKVAAPPHEPSVFEMLNAWAAPRAELAQLAPTRSKQIVAFSDPSDALTYTVPPLPPVTVLNVFDRNETNWFNLFANPLKAHSGHSANPKVLSYLFKT